MGRRRSKPLPPGVHERVYASGTVAYWIDFRDQHGERVQEKGGDTIEAAVRLLRERRTEVAAGTFTRAQGSARQTVRAYAGRWCVQRKAEGIRTWQREQQILDDHVLPVLGAKPLADLRPRDVAAWVRGLVAAGEMAPKSIINAHGVLAVMLARARFDELITDNPAKDLPRGVLPKNVRKRQVGPWTRAELEQLMSDERLDADRRVIYAIAAFTGTRAGEIAGLRWRDIDTAASPLWRWALRTQYDGQELKTDNPRDVPIHPELQRMLAAWKLEGWPQMLGRRARPDDLVAPRPNGTMHDHVSIGARAVQRHARRIGIDPTGRDFHSFRRSLVTFARVDGARPDFLERVTHNAAGEMIDVYTYFGWPELCEAIACLKLAPLRGVVLPLRKVASGDANGDAAGDPAVGSVGGAGKPSNIGDLWTPSARSPTRSPGASPASR